MQNTIISKRTKPFVYTAYKFVNNNLFQDGPGIVINGGSGLIGGAELLSGRPLEKRSSLVPVGVFTFVDDETLERLERIPKFVSDVKKGLMVVIKHKKVTNQDEVDRIATEDMLPDYENQARPYTKEQVEAAGGDINDDGSVNIAKAAEDLDRVRREDAGQAWYQRKANAEKRRTTRGRKSSKK